MWELAALIAFFFAGIGTLLNLVPVSRKNSNSYSYSGFAGMAVVAGVLDFGLSILLNWAFIYNESPAVTVPGIVGCIVFNAIITGAVFFALMFLTNRLGLAPVIAVATIAVMLVVSVAHVWTLGEGNAKKLAHTVTVEVEKPGTYPNTSSAHIQTVGEQAARTKANAAMNQRISPTSNQTLATRYDVGPATKQIIKGHLYWVFELVTDSWTDTKAVHYTVPGWIQVDAENSNNNAEAVLGHAIHWWHNGPFRADIDRHVWNKGYHNPYVDDLTLEIDDSGHPFYTASLNKAPLRWQQAIPANFITVDAETGTITKYDLAKVPTWVDRVYSAQTAKVMLNNWGHWGDDKAHYKFLREGKSNRYRINGGLNLVYTDNGPAWQAMMSSWRSDKSVQFIALMDARTGKARMYPAPNQLQQESTVRDAFNKNAANVKSLDPAELSLHKVFGIEVWVASMVPNGKADDQTDNNTADAQPYLGTGVMNATSADASKAIIGKDAADAFNQLAVQIAQGSTNTKPGEDSLVKQADGKIKAVSVPIQLGGSTYILFKLDSDPVHIFKGVISTKPETMDMALARVGNSVSITYTVADPTDPHVNIISLTNNSLSTN